MTKQRRNAPCECGKTRLLEWRKDQPDIESIGTKPQKEVREFYCDRMAASIWHREQMAKEKPSETTGVKQPEESVVSLPEEVVGDS
jgi:hypothetical protein